MLNNLIFKNINAKCIGLLLFPVNENGTDVFDIEQPV